MANVKLFVACLAVYVCVAVNEVAGFSNGPPASSQPDLVCRQMTPSPNPGAHGDPQSGNGSFLLEISPSMTEVSNGADGFAYAPDTEYTSMENIVSNSTNCDTIFTLVQFVWLVQHKPSVGLWSMLECLVTLRVLV